MERKSSSSVIGKKNLKSDSVLKNKTFESLVSLNSFNESNLLKLENLFSISQPIYKDVIKRTNLLQFEEYQKIINQLKRPNSIKELIGRFITIKHFKNYETLVVYYHLRGQPFANGLSCDHLLNYTPLKSDVSNFTQLFNQIKKSKNKIFNNSNNVSEILPIIGTYIAQTIQTNFYDLVFVLTRNDFLPPEEYEIKNLNFFVKNSTPFFSSILKKKDKEAKFELLKDILDKSSIPFCVSSKNKELYKTSNYITEDSETSKIKISHDIEVKFKQSDGSSKTSEILHFQRVAILGELLNTLQHELSNPLFGIRLTSELKLLEVEDPEELDFYKEIHNSSLRCQGIIKDFSSLYAEEDGFEFFSLFKLIKEALTLSKSATQNISINFETDKDLQELKIYSNPKWVNQIIFNAIINSAQALNNDPNTHKKNISISIEKSLTDVAITVSDNGPGIGKSDPNKLFSAFYTTKENGTGLGLSICKNLADKLEAEVYLDNNDNKGSIFTLVLKNEKNIIS